MGTNSGWVVGWADLAGLSSAAGKLPEIEVDMRNAEVPVDRLVYRVAARLGLVDHSPNGTGPWQPGARDDPNLRAASFSRGSKLDG